MANQSVTNIELKNFITNKVCEQKQMQDWYVNHCFVKEFCNEFTVANMGFYACIVRTEWYI